MSLTIGGYKSIARGSLRGHWGQSISAWLITAIFGGFLFTAPFLLIHIACVTAAMYYGEVIPHYFSLLFVFETTTVLIAAFVGSALYLGYIHFNFELLDRRESSALDVFELISYLFKAVVMRIVILCLIAIGLVCFLVPGIWAWLAYSMTPYILEQKKNYTVLEAMRTSRLLMNGRKMDLLSLRLSFIGWYILGFATCGLIFFYAYPYYHVTETVYFNEISGRAEAFYGRRKEKDKR